MALVYPDYYKKFKCIADKCRHNCCIGWEIDIDPDTLGFYNSLNSPLGDKLRENIELSPQPHFILQKDERCPFLNECNLCEIIIEHGEKGLCHICHNHPRFINEFEGVKEIGIGMSCEEAARLILSQEEPVALVCDGDGYVASDPIISLRNRILGCIQERSVPLDTRFKNAFSLLEVTSPQKPVSFWADLFLNLERLDPKWTDILEKIKATDECDLKAVQSPYTEVELEHLAVYFLYRHFALAPDIEEAKLRLLFAALSCMIILLASLTCFKDNNALSFESKVDLCRMYSAEIEYSDENTERILDTLFALTVSDN